MTIITTAVRVKLLLLSIAIGISILTVASSTASSSRRRRVLKYHDGKKERTIKPLVPYSELLDQQQEKDSSKRSTAIHTYHASPLPNPPHGKYESRQEQPKRRRDLNPYDSIDPLRHVNYTLHNPQERELRIRHHRSKPPQITPKSTLQETKSPYQPLRIHYDTSELLSWINNSTTSPLTKARIDYLTNYVLPATAQLWSESLSVFSTSSPLIIDYNWCPFGSKSNLSPSFTSGVLNADLVIYVTANGKVCKENESVLASAFSCYWDQYQRPIGGNIDFCLERIEEEGHLGLMKIEDESSVERLRMEERYGGWSIVDVEDVIARTNNRNEELMGNSNYEEVTDDSEEKGQEYTPLTKEEEQILAFKKSKSNKLLAMAIGTAMHEFAHVLGVTSDDLLFYYDSTTGLPRTTHPKLETVECITEGYTQKLWLPSNNTLQKVTTSHGISYYEIVTPIVTTVIQNQFNCSKATIGARLENQPTNPTDCFGSHFDERYFLTENMSPVLGGIPEILSSLTLALLHDSGWYEPNYEMVRVSPFGHGAGCDFLEQPCLENNDGSSSMIPEFSKGYFCNVEYPLGSGGGAPLSSFLNDKTEDGGYNNGLGCDVTHTHIGHCDLVDYQQLQKRTTTGGNEMPEEQYSYFPENKFLGALMETTDFCPTYSIDPISCREIPTALSSNKLPKFPNIPLLTQRQVESTGPNARCFNTNSIRPICLNAKCNQDLHAVEVMIGTNYTFVCQEDGEMIKIPGTEVLEFECPRLADMCPDLICPANCAGHGKCDYSLRNPECRCFIDSDKSPGCYNSFETVTPKVVWDDSVILNNGIRSIDIGFGLRMICLFCGLLSFVLVYTSF